VKDRRLFYLLRSEALYAGKHFGAARAALLLGVLLVVQVPARAAHAALTRSLADAGQVLRGGAMLCRDLPRLVARIWRTA
jgi:hypothetical protein